MIAIDTTFFGHLEAQNKKFSLSTSIFTADLLDAFSVLGLAENFCLLVNYNHADFLEERFPQYKQIVLRHPVLSMANAILKKPLTKFLKKWGVFKKAAEKNCDAIWYPYTVPATYVKTKLPAFLTIHDLYQFHHGGLTTAHKDFALDKKNTIICISEYTKADVQNSLGAKVTAVIPNSIKFDVSKTKRPEQIQDKFILDINAYDPKKNTLTLLKAFSKICGEIPQDLVLCGGYKKDVFFTEIQNFIKEKNLADRVKILFRVSDEERNWLLKNASLFVTPSLFEGFGRTPVEAAVCKIPVISTKETALFEATKGLVHYVSDAKNPDEYTKMILQVLSNPDSPEKLSQISETLKNEYIPENCAKRYAEIFGIN